MSPGRLTGELELTCSRCLEPFMLPVATDFDLRYVPRVENAGEGEQEVEEDDLATAFYADDQIDLGQLVMEQFQLALPMKPLCQEAARACPQCGTNLNTGTCDCSHEMERSRVRSAESDEANELTNFRTFELSNFHERFSPCQIPNGGTRNRARPSAARTTRLSPTQSSDCPNCREPKPPHRACPHCGYYRGRQVRAVDEASRLSRSHS